MMKVVSNIYWILGALLTALFVRGFIISVYKIPTVSMAPTLLPGDFILSSQIAYRMQFPWSSEVYFKANPERNDLVIVQFSAKKAAAKSMAHYLKRVVAVAGDEIEVQQGRIILNGKPCVYEKIDETTKYNETCNGQQRQILLSGEGNKNSADTTLESAPKQKIPENEIFVLGDNRTMVDDSRTLGTLLTDQIASKVGLIWLSYGPGSSTQDFISGPNQIRWNRILTKPH